MLCWTFNYCVPILFWLTNSYYHFNEIFFHIAATERFLPWRIILPLRFLNFGNSQEISLLLFCWWFEFLNSDLHIFCKTEYSSMRVSFFEKCKRSENLECWKISISNSQCDMYVFFLTEKLSPSQLWVGLLRMWNSLVSFGRGGSNTFPFLTLAANNLTYIISKNNFWHKFTVELSWLFFKQPRHLELVV